MLLFCRNCGKELVVTPEKTCSNCRAKPVKAFAFCRYCGNKTTAEDVICPTCGAAIRPIHRKTKALHKERETLVTLGKILKVTIAVALITTYAAFTLPPSLLRPLKAAVSDATVASVGYTATPLTNLSAVPPMIPELVNYGLIYIPPGITVNTTQQLTIYAVYKNATSGNGTKATRLEDVTDNSTFQSSNNKIATVSASGLVKATGPGTTNITASYTAVPGSSNLTAALAEGKKPVTFTVDVIVIVK